MARYELTRGSSNKFWEIELAKSSVTTTYGRIGTKGQKTVKTCKTAEAAKKLHDQLVAEKTKKGYKLVGGTADKTGARAPRKAGMPMRNFAKAFKAGSKYKDQHHTYTVKLVEFGQVTLPTGRVFAADPLTYHSTEPFARKVKPGTYSITGSVAKIQPLKKGGRQERVACVMLRFAKGEPASWINATKKSQSIAKLGSDQFYGYGVDAGAGCFCDVTAIEALKVLDDAECANDNWEGWLLGKIGDKILSDQHHGSAITVPKTKANIVGFHSGWGDGFYGSYWGLSKSGAALCLVTDFGVYPTDAELEL